MTNTDSTSTISVNEIKKQLCSTLFITGSFCVAWSWDLVAYGGSHAWNDESPMKEQLGFGDQRSPKYLPILLLEYLIVCGLTSVLSYEVKQRYASHTWCAATIMAVEFLPAPFFSGKLMAYLGQFAGLSSIKMVGLNLLAAGFCAFLAQVAQDDTTKLMQHLPPQLSRFGHIIAETLAFGLGVAWNVFLMEILGPNDDNELSVLHLVGLFGYLMVVSMIAFRLAAMEKEETGEERPALLKRTLSMLSFAFNVVCAFTIVALVRALMTPGFVGDVGCLVILLIMAAVLSAIVAAVDMEESNAAANLNTTSTSIRRSKSWWKRRLLRRSRKQQEQPKQTAGEDSSDNSSKLGFGTCWALDMLVFVPCVWLCCPWVPLVWILAGLDPNVAVKKRWQSLIAFVLGLATSIQASGMLTTLTNTISTELDICGPKRCDHEWLFVLLQVLLAVLTTFALIPALTLVTEPTALQEEETPSSRGQSQKNQPAEETPLLERLSESYMHLSEQVCLV